MEVEVEVCDGVSSVLEVEVSGISGGGSTGTGGCVGMGFRSGSVSGVSGTESSTTRGWGFFFGRSGTTGAESDSREVFFGMDGVLFSLAVFAVIVVVVVLLSPTLSPPAVLVLICVCTFVSTFGNSILLCKWNKLSKKIHGTMSMTRRNMLEGKGRFREGGER